MSKTSASGSARNVTSLRIGADEQDRLGHHVADEEKCMEGIIMASEAVADSATRSFELKRKKAK